MKCPLRRFAFAALTAVLFLPSAPLAGDSSAGASAALPLEVQLENGPFLYEEPSHSSSTVALLKRRARITVLAPAPAPNLGSIWWLVETDDTRPKRTVRGFLLLFLPNDLHNPSPESLQTLEMVEEEARKQQLADYVEEHRERYWQARERAVSRDDGPPAPGIPRDRCDGVIPETSSRYHEAPVVEVRQVLRPRSPFTEEASVECRQSGAFEDGPKIRDYQTEFGAKGDLQYRVRYSDASGSVYKPTDPEFPETLWSLDCDLDSMDDSKRCHLSRGPLSVWYVGQDQWVVFVGGADNYPDSEIAIRFGDAEPILGKEPSFTGAIAAQVAEALEGEGRVRLRYQKWPSGIGEEDFEARGFRLAKDLMLWAFEALAP